MPKNSLHKDERVKSRKLIASLFEHGQKLHQAPLMLIWLPIESGSHPLKFGVSVPKRKFKRAIDRNLLKRRLRESYRISKHDLILNLTSDDKSYALFVVYVGHKIAAFDDIQRSMNKLMNKWRNRLKSQSDKHDEEDLSRRQAGTKDTMLDAQE